MRFSEIPGLQATKKKLLNGVKNNHVAHAQLFYGPEGVPNLAIALAYIAYLNCKNQGVEDSCGTCSSCTKLDKLIHPDLHLVFPVAPTDKIKSKDVVSDNFVKEWRTFALGNPYGIAQDWFTHYGFESKQGNISKEESRQIVKALSLKAFEAKYKVMLIWLPEYMHPAASNAILKIIEEPPPMTLFVMVSNNYEKLLTTIISRTQLFNIPKWEDADLISLLMSREGLTETEAAPIAARANGSLFEATKLLQFQEDETPLSFAQWVRSCWSLNIKELVDASNQFSKLSKMSQKATLMDYIAMLRNVMLFTNSIDLLKVKEEDRKFLEDFGKATDFEKIEALMQEINSSIGHIEQNASAKIVFFDASVKTGMLLKAKK
jgi:DNA polymerase-3 subunit delta'